MKKKKLWFSCIMLLFGTVKALIRRNKKETVYILSFVVKEPDEKEWRICAYDASKKVAEYLSDHGYPFIEYKTYETNGKNEEDTREVLTFFLMMLSDAQASEILETVKQELGLKTAFCTKEEHSYRELKKQIQ